ncbi:MAG: rhomboid family intramembrane serine protease [Mycobacteriaceae bacterium]
MVVGSFTVMLYVIELADVILGHRLDHAGIEPQTVDGFWGILFAPILHAGWGHVLANTLPTLVLGFLCALAGLRQFIIVTAIIWIVSGMGTWFLGDIGTGLPANMHTTHLGASSLIFGWLTFLLTRGLFTRNLWQILLGVAVFCGYGGLLWGIFPGRFGISWQGHLCGAVAGVLAAWFVASRGRGARKGRSWPPTTVSGL